ncbi:hypothetical protein CVT26_004798 [Gymnopilus dilepis]|uniref:F-box domain-containing protein n=1 Tax=Gymnopilus dilepis TaxID=231916 RepID=A0A409XZI7_9AGAR|nr:hypothetical protein CVT26_004798 [Gymnopilus dilepis]
MTSEKKNQVLLPYELERDIFELTARAYPCEAVKLSTISKYVQEWVEAVIYETVVLDFPLSRTESFLDTFLSRPPSFFARTVKRLHITTVVPFTQARAIIAACSNITDLTCWADPNNIREDLISVIPSEQIHRLSIKLTGLWGAFSERPSQQFTPKLFPNLTHLEIVNPTGPNARVQIDLDGLLSLPKLTHLALGELWIHYHLDLIPHLQRALEQSPKLRVLLLISRDVHFLDFLAKSGVQRDCRVVVQEEFCGPLSAEDYWEEIRQGGMDFWSSAEKMVLENSRNSGAETILKA